MGAFSTNSFLRLTVDLSGQGTLYACGLGVTPEMSPTSCRCPETHVPSLHPAMVVGHRRVVMSSR